MSRWKNGEHSGSQRRPSLACVGSRSTLCQRRSSLPSDRVSSGLTGRHSKWDGREGGGWLLPCHCAGSLLSHALSFSDIASASQRVFARPVGGRRELTISYGKLGSSFQPYRFEP